MKNIDTIAAVNAITETVGDLLEKLNKELICVAAKPVILGECLQIVHCIQRIEAEIRKELINGK